MHDIRSVTDVHRGRNRYWLHPEDSPPLQGWHASHLTPGGGCYLSIRIQGLRQEVVMHKGGLGREVRD